MNDPELSLDTDVSVFPPVGRDGPGMFLSPVSDRVRWTRSVWDAREERLTRRHAWRRGGVQWVGCSRLCRNSFSTADRETHTRDALRSCAFVMLNNCRSSGFLLPQTSWTTQRLNLDIWKSVEPRNTEGPPPGPFSVNYSVGPLLFILFFPTHFKQSYIVFRFNSFISS